MTEWADASVTTPSGDRSPPVRVVGRYLIHGAIGHGGMASVHLGRLRGDAGFTRVVAIKRLQDSLANDPSFVTMFTEEARLAARIRHPNVVSTLDVVASEEELFHVIDYVHGETVAKLMWAAKQAKHQTPVDVAVRIVCDTLQGLHAAHEACDEQGQALGLVHRDVSPQNVIVGVDGVARVLDFGVAKARGQAQTTKSGGIKGKIGYMPPEQLYGEPVDRRADLYAAGVLLWEMLAGKRLFAGDEGQDALALALTAPVWRPSVHNGDVPDVLDEIVLRALNRERTKRFTTAQEMADAMVAAVTPAQPSKVASWVKSLAGDAIEKRSRMLAIIEADQAVDHVPPEVDVVPECRSLLGDEKLMASLTIAPPPRARSHRSVTIMIVVAAVVIAIIGWFARVEQEPERTVSPITTAPSSPAPIWLDAATAAESATASTSAPAPSASVLAPKPTRKAPPPPPRVTQPAGGVPKPSCNPPWEIDEKGHRRYKRECLR